MICSQSSSAPQTGHSFQLAFTGDWQFGQDCSSSSSVDSADKLIHFLGEHQRKREEAKSKLEDFMMRPE